MTETWTENLSKNKKKEFQKMGEKISKKDNLGLISL